MLQRKASTLMMYHLLCMLMHLKITKSIYIELPDLQELALLELWLLLQRTINEKICMGLQLEQEFD
jgi:hypothetical protein